MIGYKKIKAPESLYHLIKGFGDKNHDKAKPEQWGVGNIYKNNWELPTSMVSMEDMLLHGSSYKLKEPRLF